MGKALSGLLSSTGTGLVIIHVPSSHFQYSKMAIGNLYNLPGPLLPV